MAMVYPMQMLLAGFTLLLASPLATSSTIATTSKEVIKCNHCTPVLPPPPPPGVDCPPPPSPLPPPVPSPPPKPPTPVPSPPPLSPAPVPRPPPPPACTGCFPICIWCPLPCSNLCPQPCPGCAPPSCNVCQIPQGPPPPRLQSMDQQPGVIGGAVYSPPNEVVPYFPRSASESAAISIHLELKLVVSIIFILLSASFSFF